MRQTTANRRAVVRLKPTVATVALWAGVCSGALAQASAPPATQTHYASLADLSLEQLGNVRVTSVSGREEPLGAAPASIYVITHDDIRRSTATNLPEALRLAPNLQVAQTSAGQYAISARGFNNSIANKLLVLIDGRTIYSTLFSGVFWDAHEVLLDDIDRIEVISGPGGTLWGANAVNGVINVITRDASATQGTRVSAARSDRQGRQSVRWGGALGESGHLRLYGLTIDRERTELASGARRMDDAQHQQVGFRADWKSAASQLTLQGDAYSGGDAPFNNFAPKLRGANMLARWTSQFPSGSPYKLQVYVDSTERDETSILRNKARNLDLQFTHEPRMPVGQQLLWGAEYRRGTDTNLPTVLVLFSPAEKVLTSASLFAQHQIQMSRQWELTTGAKVEHNTYTGTEVLPNARLAVRHSPERMTWLAASRVVRAPARIDRDFFFPGAAPFIIAGGPNFESERATVLEVGHRAQLGKDLTYAVTAFRQHYKGLRAGDPNKPPPAMVENQIEGPGQGIEAWTQWQVNPDWRLSAGYTALRKKLRFSSGASDLNSIPNLGNDPRQQWSLRSSLDIGPRSELDVMVRRVGALPSPAVPAYTAVDLRLAYQIHPRLELSLLAQNLLDKRHVEFNASGVASQIERRVFIKAVWQL